MSKTSKIFGIIWLVIIIVFWAWAIYEDVKFTPESIAGYLERFQKYIIWAYLIFSMLRAFTLLPNMTVVFVGALLIHNFWILLITSIIGLCVSSSLIYFFGNNLSFMRSLAKRHPQKVEKIHKGLERYGGLIIFFWGFFPVVPSDLLSFVLGDLKYNYWKFIAYYALSHLITYSVIIYFGKGLWQLILSPKKL